ncbi:YtxH domain-containing protein [Rufibacter sediminis]|uniref:YtxH domain-containing protein n=1 Tax=Rufibacter sediminis TaxID=2762756 RepID=A0ABR6VVZ3_9BACT|nr:YtxH domain-containing protein [Rufibacter sediminis]MBC3541354.1 YtxH domain-containing protein [Rufibacter sediminis]
MKNDNSKILIAAAAGAAAGVVAGILMAPSNGKDSRKDILKAAGQLAESVNGQIAPYLEKLSGLTSLLGGSEASKNAGAGDAAGANNTGAQS